MVKKDNQRTLHSFLHRRGDMALVSFVVALETIKDGKGDVHYKVKGPIVVGCRRSCCCC